MAKKYMSMQEELAARRAASANCLSVLGTFSLSADCVSRET